MTDTRLYVVIALLIVFVVISLMEKISGTNFLLFCIAIIINWWCGEIYNAIKNK